MTPLNTYQSCPFENFNVLKTVPFQGTSLSLEFNPETQEEQCALVVDTEGTKKNVANAIHSVTTLATSNITIVTSYLYPNITHMSHFPILSDLLHNWREGLLSFWETNDSLFEKSFFLERVQEETVMVMITNGHSSQPDVKIRFKDVLKRDVLVFRQSHMCEGPQDRDVNLTTDERDFNAHSSHLLIPFENNRAILSEIRLIHIITSVVKNVQNGLLSYVNENKPSLLTLMQKKVKDQETYINGSCKHHCQTKEACL